MGESDRGRGDAPVEDGYLYVIGDGQTQDRWVGLLRAEGVRVWDPKTEIKPGEPWGRVIVEAVKHADAAVLLISERSQASAYVGREAYLAAEANVTIIPVRLDHSTLSDSVGYAIEGLQETDVSTDEEEHSAARRIVRLLPESVRSSGSVAVREAASKGYMFLSYADEDAEFVGRLRRFLTDRGYAFWDYRESERNYHVALSLELEEVIMGAAAMACVLSPDWKRSRWALRELAFADEADKPYLLLQARPMGPTLATAGMTFIDFQADERRGFELLDRELTRKGL